MDKAELIKLLETGYHEHRDLGNNGTYFSEFTNSIHFEDEFVELRRSTAYDGEEDMSNEYFNASWTCSRVKRKDIEDLILELDKKPEVEVKVFGTINESGSGRKAYGTYESGSKEYEGEITINLKLKDNKPILLFQNLNEMHWPEDVTR